MILFFLSLAPVLVILTYLYYRDKYEKEPFRFLLISLLAGALTVIPVFVVTFPIKLSFLGNNPYVLAFGNAFLEAAIPEEFFKYLAFLLVVWRNKNFNDFFDGIIYAAYISLGFAAIENVLYVLESGFVIGIIRAVTAVPAHALFGITMGYYFSLAKFIPSYRLVHLIAALLLPIILHGAYDYILMVGEIWLLYLFLPFVAFLWYSGFLLMKKHNDLSIFKPHSSNNHLG